MEFPEVLTAGGFNAFVGNPPFMGGLKLETAFGTDYRAYLVGHLGRGVVGVRGTADLCAYFFLRTAQLLSEHASIALLATNTIAQGDSARVGLDQLVGDGLIVYRANASTPWPGEANLEIAHVWLRRGQWLGAHVLDGRVVNQITAQLSGAGRASGKPHRLVSNAGKAFIGSYVLGLGFTMPPEEAKALIRANKANRDVLFPYVTGQDLNSDPEQRGSRWVINFKDWPLDRKTAPEGYDGPVAADYPECLAIVRKLVKPERDAIIGRNAMSTRRGTLWWRYAGDAKNLYLAIGNMKRVLVRARVSSTHALALVPSSQVFADVIVVFRFDSTSELALLNSMAHAAWTDAYASSMRTDTRYTPTDCFETFAFPARVDGLEGIGSRYEAHRTAVMQNAKEGLTKTYNRFHSSDVKSADIRQLRDLHVEMDEVVRDAYGWGDLRLAHAFHATKQGVRFTISEAARVEVLDRLLALNHERYAEEVKAGLHEGTDVKAAQLEASRSKAPANARIASSPKRTRAKQVELLDGED